MDMVGRITKLDILGALMESSPVQHYNNPTPAKPCFLFALGLSHFGPDRALPGILVQDGMKHPNVKSAEIPFFPTAFPLDRITVKKAVLDEIDRMFDVWERDHPKPGIEGYLGGKHQ